MKKTIVTAVFALMLCAVTVVTVQAELYPRAPDVLRGTTPEMRDPQFWIRQMDNPDEVVMSQAQIEAMNKRFWDWINSDDPFAGVPEVRMPKLSNWWPGYLVSTPDLKKLGGKAAADTVRSRIGIAIHHMRKQEYGAINAVEYAPWQLDEFEAEMALDDLGSSVTINDAIVVRTARFRNVPTETPDQMGLRENAKTRWDLWNVGIAKIGMPVQVLHRSKSGEYVYVYSEIGYAWIRTVDIAFSYQAKIDEFTNPDRFVVCTGDRVPFYSDESCTYSAGWFRMGDHLPLADKNSDRKVLVPVRKTNGDFMTETAWLAKDADVSVGYLPYTRKNVVLTAFKLLDNNYDWTGAWFGRQHETTYRDIFSVFGFKLPYWGALFTFFNKNCEDVLLSDVGTEAQYKRILENEPFVTLQSCGGHAQLLLGQKDGVPIVFDQHGYGYEDEDGTFLEVRRCCIGDQRLPSYFLKNKVTFLILK